MNSTALTFTAGQNTTTTDTSRGLLLRIHREQGDYFVSDLTGVRFGYGKTVDEALKEWWFQVADLLALDETTLGDPVLTEARAYKEALR